MCEQSDSNESKHSGPRQILRLVRRVTVWGVTVLLLAMAIAALISTFAPYVWGFRTITGKATTFAEFEFRLQARGGSLDVLLRFNSMAYADWTERASHVYGENGPNNPPIRALIPLERRPPPPVKPGEVQRSYTWEMPPRSWESGPSDWTWLGISWRYLGSRERDQARFFVWTLSLPAWVILLPLLLPGWVLFGMACRRWRRRLGRCRRCGYDLRATPDRCPECGTPVSICRKSVG